MSKSRLSLIVLFLLPLSACGVGPSAVGGGGWIPVAILLFAVLVLSIIIGRKVF